MGMCRTGWVPPHCPNPNCSYFNAVGPTWPYKRKGFFTRRCVPTCIQRFTCLACGRHFSSQTFSTTYWQKRPELIPPIFSMVVGCMANRQIARSLGCSPSTVAHHIARLGRHCMLFQGRDLGRVPAAGEVVIDGFESFEFSQYYPFHHNVAVDVDTGYVLYHTDSPLRRKGRMTRYQKRRRKELEAEFGRPNPSAVEHGVRELLETVSRGRPAMTVRSDDHRAYPRAMRGLNCPVTHRITSSKKRRDKRNPLWEVNLLDLMIRHSTAAHKRETIAWAKRRQVSAEKLTIFQVWRNYVKRRWEKGPDESAAMLAGLAHRRLTLRDLLVRRIFREHIRLPRRWHLYYDRRVKTVALGVNRLHTLTYAY
jgi:transposase-like protein